MNRPEFTPEFISELEPNEIFTFGSNYQGDHQSGAAKTALGFGAKRGIGKGLQGQTYAFPTVVHPGAEHRLSNISLHVEMIDYLITVEKHPDLIFYLTKIGCGLAGISIEEMREVFQFHYKPKKYPNLIYPIEFK